MKIHSVVTISGAVVNVSEEEFNDFLEQLSILDPSYSCVTHFVDLDCVIWKKRKYRLSNGILCAQVIENED